MKKKFFVKRLGSLLLAGAMALSAVGCAGAAEADGSNGEQADTMTEAGENSTGMGRYVETVTDLSDYNERADGIARLSDGRLVILDYYMGQIESEDNGVTWNLKETDWFTSLQNQEAYIMDLTMGADGTVGVIYNVSSAEEEASEDFELDPKCVIIKPDGTQVEVEISLSDDEMYPFKVWITDTGRIFVTTLGETIYEIKEDGSSEKFLTAEGGPRLVQFAGDLMIMDGYSFEDGLLLYDMEKKEYTEDEVLNKFVLENYPDREFNGDSWYDLYFFSGEEGVLYLAGKEGLHRHVLEGSAIEQVVDGALSSFSNPANGLLGMTALENNEFLALFSGGRLVRYTYNPDIPTTPSERLKVYSLKESDTMRQAISIYQTVYPDIFVEYEVGMEEDHSVTREDALKKLNTQMMAGEGPDLLVLDDMPADSYIEKGMLLDLSTCLGSLSGETELFPSIVNAFKEDEKIYMVPCEIQLPMVLGKENDVSQMDSLAGIADSMEMIRKENPERGLLDLFSEEGILRLFSMTSAPAWKTDSGEIDREAITEFLKQTRRIYEAQMEGATDKEIERYNNVNEYYVGEYGVTREESDYFGAMDDMSYIGGKTQIVMGTASYPYGYAELNSVQRVKGFEDNRFLPLNGQSQNVFIPKTLAGINAISEKIEMAQDLLKVLLGEDNQTSLFKGFAVNKAAFEESFVPNEKYLGEDGLYGAIAMSDEDGLMISMDIYWVDDEQLESLRNWIAKADTPYIKDSILEDAVCEEGTNYIQGNKGLEEAVGSIMEKAALYMAE
ncbi:MAG: extracellular solute-binding protein [Lachnospiraceae bacterium]